MSHHVKNHNTIQVGRLYPVGAKRLTIGLRLLLGGGLGLNVFRLLLRVGIEGLDGYVTVRGSGLFSTGYLGKVFVRDLISCGLLVRRNLTGHQDVLTQSIRTDPPSASIGEYGQGSEQGEKRKFRLHNPSASSKGLLGKKQRLPKA